MPPRRRTSTEGGASGSLSSGILGISGIFSCGISGMEMDGASGAGAASVERFTNPFTLGALAWFAAIISSYDSARTGSAATSPLTIAPTAAAPPPPLARVRRTAPRRVPPPAGTCRGWVT